MGYGDSSASIGGEFEKYLYWGIDLLHMANVTPVTFVIKNMPIDVAVS